MTFFGFLKPSKLVPECTCGHLKYTHRYLGGTFACAAVECTCSEYTEITNAPEA